MVLFRRKSIHNGGTLTTTAYRGANPGAKRTIVEKQDLPFYNGRQRGLCICRRGISSAGNHPDFWRVLEYEGKFYKVGTVRQEVKDTKVEDDSFLSSHSLATVLRNLKEVGV